MRIGISTGKTHPVIVAEAAAWFIEFRAGDVHGEARLQFIEWLRRSPEHIQAYLEVSGVWAELPSSDPEGRIDIASLIARAHSEPDVIALSRGTAGPLHAPAAVEAALPPRWRRAALAMAAAALLAAVSVLLLRGGNPGGSYSTGIGELRTVQLADGSTVELNARSTIQVQLTQQERNVTLLDGQAFFRVAKDKQRPFIVRAGDAQVRAVGTEFDV
jgi:transmembrane sensor